VLRHLVANVPTDRLTPSRSSVAGFQVQLPASCPPRSCSTPEPTRSIAGAMAGFAKQLRAPVVHRNTFGRGAKTARRGGRSDDQTALGRADARLFRVPTGYGSCAPSLFRRFNTAGSFFPQRSAKLRGLER
jgi:hypothetical protein